VFLFVLYFFGLTKKVAKKSRLYFFFNAPYTDKFLKSFKLT